MDSGIERVEQIVEASQEAVRRHRRRRAPRRFLRGCAIGCAVILLILFGVWWYVSRNLGDLISGVVKKQAAESLYGRLEFSKLKVDLAGRAVFSDLEVYADASTGLDTETAQLTAPRVSASLDFFTLFGPNRGKRAIALTVEDAKLRVIREADGSFKLSRIFREQEKKREPWGIAITLKDAEVDFTDRCLLGKTDLKLDKEGLGSRLLDELGYRVARDGDAVVNRSPVPEHHELAVLNGSIAINGEREEIGLKLEAQRPEPGGRISVEGLLADDGSRYELNIGLQDTQLVTASGYFTELFPRLLISSTDSPETAAKQTGIADAATTAGQRASTKSIGKAPSEAAGPVDPRPELKLLIEKLDLKLAKQPGEEVQSQSSARFRQLQYDSPLLGRLQLDDSSVEFTPKKLLALDLNLQALGARVSGKPSLRWDEKDPGLIHLDGRLNLRSDDFKSLRAGASKLPLKPGAKLPELSGSGEASLDLGGTTRSPELRFKASGEKLAYEKYKAGKLSASGSYSGPPGAPDISFDLEASDGDVAGLAVGRLNAKGDYKGPPGTASGKATLSTSALNYGDLKLGKLNAQVSIDKGVATLSKGSLSGGEVPLSASGKLNLKTKDGSVKASLGPLEFADLLALGNKAQSLAPGAKAKTTAKSPQIKDVSGKVTASADALIVKGKFSGSLGLQSEKLVVSGTTLKTLAVKGGIEQNSIRIDSAEATVLTKEAIDLAGFSSSGPLSLKARAGGTLSLPPAPAAGKKAAPMTLALTGKASTSNLSPEQANISFKLAGPASGPELKLQLKTTAKSNPLALSAKLTLKEGLAPATVSLSWYASKLDYEGKLDFKGQKIEGSLSASELDLGRFTASSALSGKLGAKARISGSFKAPDIAGQLSSQRLSFEGGERSYDITALSAGFKLNSEARSGKDKNGKPLGPKLTLAVSDGSFSFEGMPFTAKGVLGREGSELSLKSPSFNLFSVLALVPEGSGKIPQIEASGPLSIDFSGTPENPKAKISYSSGAGSVEGHKFSSAALSADASKSRLDLSELKVVSAEGSISASGTMTYTLPQAGRSAGSGGKSGGGNGGAGKGGESSEVIARAPGQEGRASAPVKQPAPAKEKTPPGKQQPIPPGNGDEDSAGDSTPVGWLGIQSAHAQGSGKGGFKLTSFTAQATVDDFDIGILTPLSGDTPLSELSGRVSGAFSISGSAGELNGSGDLRLSNGKFHGIPIEQATATLRTNRLADGRLQMLVEDGRISSAKTRLNASGKIGPDAADSSFNVEAEALDLALLTPFVPEGSPRLSGVLTGSLSLQPGKGAFPKMTVSLRDNGKGVSIGEGVRFTALAADARMENDLLTVQNLKVTSQGSSLSAGGTLNPALFSQAKGGGSKLPLDFWLKSDKFDFSDAVALAGPLLKPEQLKLVPDGSISADLQLKGTAKAPQLTGSANFNLSRLPGELPVQITGLSGKVRFIEGNGFELQDVRLGTGSDPALSAAQISGSGELAFSAPFMKSGSIDINLSPDGKFIPIELKDSFSGTIGGRLTLSGKPVKGKSASSLASDFNIEIGGKLLVSEGAGKSTYTYNPPPRGTVAKVNRNLRFRDLRVLLNAGTTFRFTPPSAAQKLALSDMTVSLQSPKPSEEDGSASELVINGIPGVLDKNDSDALRVKGEVNIPSGTLLIYKYKVKMDGLKNSLKFSGQPGDIYPEFSGRGKLTLPRVLKGYDAGISLPGGDSIPVGGGGGGGSSGRSDDLTIFFNFDRVKLEPGAGLGKFTLTSSPSMAPEKIQGYLLGGVTDVLTGQTGLGDFAEGELISFGSSFISRQIERSFDLESFNIGGAGSADNPYYMDVEKAVSPNVSLTYYRNFFSETAQEEEFGVRYKLFEEQFGDKYRGLQLNVDFNKSGLQGNGATVQVEYTVRF
ncbi:translocation/assembly module TamB domain-containing protein [bacterium]|nr:translocation/assembly module TamB domain-containing protein [bacterium]